jgi:hypothetical protein
MTELMYPYSTENSMGEPVKCTGSADIPVIDTQYAARSTAPAS